MDFPTSDFLTSDFGLITDHCGTCTRCIDACPTQCIESDREKLPPDCTPGEPASAGGSALADETGYQRSIDATRCISYLTLEHRSLIDSTLHESMDDWIAGCDVCQEVCPYNRGSGIEDSGLGKRSHAATQERGTRERSDEEAGIRSQSPIPNSQSPTLPIHPRYTPRPEFAQGLPLLDILDWSVEERQAAFQGSALKRVKLDMLRRNALIALGNHLARGGSSVGDRRGDFSRHDHNHANDIYARDADILTHIKRIAADADEPELVRDTARQVLERLHASPPASLR